MSDLEPIGKTRLSGTFVLIARPAQPKHTGRSHNALAVMPYSASEDVSLISFSSFATRSSKRFTRSDSVGRRRSSG